MFFHQNTCQKRILNLKKHSLTASLFSRKEQKLIMFIIRVCPTGSGQNARMFTMACLINTFSGLLIQPLGHLFIKFNPLHLPQRGIHMTLNPCSLFICLSKSVWVIGRTWPKYTHALTVKEAFPASSDAFRDYLKTEARQTQGE